MKYIQIIILVLIGVCLISCVVAKDDRQNKNIFIQQKDYEIIRAKDGNYYFMAIDVFEDVVTTSLKKKAKPQPANHHRCNPEIKIHVPGKVKVGDEFDVVIKIDSLHQGSSTYILKIEGEDIEILEDRTEFQVDNNLNEFRVRCKAKTQRAKIKARLYKKGIL
jgi:23S rRNA G2069 N7-methylase RlmK/C1962 C5-methylase RlmI